MCIVYMDAFISTIAFHTINVSSRTILYIISTITDNECTMKHPILIHEPLYSFLRTLLGHIAYPNTIMQQGWCFMQHNEPPRYLSFVESALADYSRVSSPYPSDHPGHLSVKRYGKCHTDEISTQSITS